MTLEAEFRNAQAVSPGQGQNVTVAGVEVGQITKVETEDGLAVVTVELEPDEVGPVYDDATMYLRPKTGLNDMTIQLDPGRPDAGLEDGGRLGDGDRIGVAQTTTNVNSDEVLGEPRRGHTALPGRLRERRRPGVEGAWPGPARAVEGHAADARAVGARQPRDRRPAREAAPPRPQPARPLRRRRREGRRAREPRGGELGRARDRRRARGRARRRRGAASGRAQLDAAGAARGPGARRGASPGGERAASAGRAS